MNLLNPDPGTIFWTALTFVFLLFILKKLAWGPILQALEERERKIKESLEKADAAQKETEAAMAKQQEIMDSAKREAQELMAKSRSTAESTKEEILKKAQDEASKMLEKAKREIDSQREKAIEEIRNEAADLSIAIASKLIGKSLSRDDHREIIDESLDKMVEAN
ncbi:F0F1 ATP synthase subunit B [candidate division KSB1 bacterium]|nr:F0F1 ATP synthase subunit B [candidate division KSB1 bacterium]NIR72740.1 F0F1 ATP synthase subunit B [candidate division KSB1 bacterium]NIS26828.1 F0F1 ATP synthase subunit B [candidate division KSB1 bacterium]NIT73622.1 F0F1 ATP synthase subunit B [candidate division KSB1 bacterium]NIU27495.1 F0F1 ATP synthase subunit B [candidate division KSB1 bacterium]